MDVVETVVIFTNVLTQLIDNVFPFTIQGVEASNVCYGGCTTKFVILVELSS